MLLSATCFSPYPAHETCSCWTCSSRPLTFPAVNTLLYIYTIYPLSKDEYLGGFQFFIIKNNDATCILIYNLVYISSGFCGQKYCTGFSSVQSLSCVRLLVTPWTAAPQASLSITNSRSLLKLMSMESVMPPNHLILCCPLLLPPSIFPSIRVFSNESVLHIRWPKYWSFSFSISPSNERPGLISFRMDWLDLLQSKGLSSVFSNTTVQKHQFLGAQLSLWSTSRHGINFLNFPFALQGSCVF